MSDYKLYPSDTHIRVIETGEEGEAFESFAGFISVWIGEETRCRYYRMDEIEFL